MAISNFGLGVFRNMRQSQSFTSLASGSRPLGGSPVYDKAMPLYRASRLSVVNSQMILSNHEKRLAATREMEKTRQLTSNDAEFQACKKLGDRELSEAIQKFSHNGKLVDLNGQHLIHWCVATEKPLSVIAICTSPLSRDEVDAKDSRGRTPLHLAVAGELEYIVTLLLNMGAKSEVLDNMRMIPMHHAVSNGNVTILEALLERCEDPNITGDGGYTALHFAAAADQPKCIEMLVHRDASLMVRSSNGTYPIHTAAKCGSARALEAIIRGAKKQGLDYNVILALKDREGQLPIHNAVNNGAAESVIVCLKYGSSLLSKKDSGSTPVSYAATQGNLDLLKTMFEFNPETFKEALLQEDYSGRTPLHWAAIFDHASVVKYLIKMSNVNTFDKNKHTPLLSAARNACWGTLTALLTHKETNTEVIDVNQRNALHIAVRQGINLDETLPVWKSVRNITIRCNEEDKTGSTPLHYAAWNGNPRDVEALLELGAKTNVKNKLRQNPFHIACKNGCHDVCLMLLNAVDGSRLKNEQDDTGQSPLHMAAARGFTPIVNVLLQRGAVISKSKSSNTPLHLAAAGGHIPCVHSLLSVHLELLDLENIDGDTALHLAACNGHAAVVNMLLSAGAEITYNTMGKCFYDDALIMGYREVMEVLIHHERWDEILSVFSQFHGQLFLGLIRYQPIPCVMVLDRCVLSSSSDKNSPDYSVTYNFRYLQLGEEYTAFAKSFKLQYSPLLPIEMMLQHERDDCLRHKLITVYLRHKWRSYGRMVNFLDICVYFLYMMCLTSFVMERQPLDHYHKKKNVTRNIDIFTPMNHPDTQQVIFVAGSKLPINFSDMASFDYSKNWFPPEAGHYENNVFLTLCLTVVCVYSLLLIFKEVLQMCTVGSDYLYDASFYLEIATYLTSLYFAAPFLFGYSTHTQWEAAAVAIFLAWFNFLFLCRRFELVGLYIVMYIEIMKTLFQILFIFLILMIAFGLAFYILQSREPYGTNSEPFLSMYRTLILLFELDYVHTVLKSYNDEKSETLHFVSLFFIFNALFLLCMPLLLVNLMIGLAVGDIQSVLRNAHQQKLATQVDFHTNLERKAGFLSRLTPEILTIYPNSYDHSTFKSRFLSFIGWKTVITEPTHTFSTSYNQRDKFSPAMQSLTEARRELGQMRRFLKQIMKRLSVEMEEYSFSDPFDEEHMEHHKVFLHEKPWVTTSKPLRDHPV